MKRRHAPSDLAERLLAGPVVWIGLAMLAAFALGPFIWMLLTSLKDRQELYATRELCRCLDLAGDTIQPFLSQ